MEEKRETGGGGGGRESTVNILIIHPPSHPPFLEKEGSHLLQLTRTRKNEIIIILLVVQQKCKYDVMVFLMSRIQINWLLVLIVQPGTMVKLTGVNTFMLPCYTRRSGVAKPHETSDCCIACHKSLILCDVALRY